ncbi:structural maintenance of chromosomes flexible hinge domain-containing protein 1 isoform X2 [Clinocottus analis]
MEQGRDRRMISVYDCRSENKEQSTKKQTLETSALDYNDFLRLLRRKFSIGPRETFVLVTTDRIRLDFDKFEKLQDGSTIHLLLWEDQALAMATEEQINFVPHYDTLIQSGMYEYYTSEGQTSLPYALAELIDNSLSATAKNTGMRTIEIRMVFDETLAKPTVIILDNGCGMTSKQLKNWAVYRLSKFSRKDEEYVRPGPVRRSLNSDISFFGVGGKQAVFYIGNSTRIITKSVGSQDVHELVLSKEEFERKEREKEDVYSSVIKNRKPGDSSHVKKDQRCLNDLIAEECGKESFTAVVITGVSPEHIAFLKKDFTVWTRQLANHYHYYIHGVNGKDINSVTNSNHLSKIDIQITLCEKPPKLPRAMNLREVDDDMQTLYINAAVDTFEFTASPKDGGTVEGLIRYHPFLYDKETYPKDPDALLDDDDDEDGYDNESGAWRQARGKSPIFDCFWNGRLIPYTKVQEFDWCAPTKTTKDLTECYSRISGALFSDDTFKVTTNKLTFLDLEMTLKKKDTIFTRVVNSQSEQERSVKDSPARHPSESSCLNVLRKQRCNIQKELTQWLRNCHEKWDKQVKFLGYVETITRTDVPTKKMQHPWATFSSIEWDGKVYKKGQLVKSQKTVPILYGRVVRFLLHGKYDDDVFATGGEVELVLEPKALYDKIKIIAISKIDKNATDEAIKNYVDNDAAKLPELLIVDWPEGNPWPQNAVRPAGTQFGPLKVEIQNKKGESLSTMPSVGKKLLVELKVVQHSPKGDQELLCYVSHHLAKCGFWFKKIETLTNKGKYTLSLTTKINEANAFGGRELPSFKLKFTINAGCAETFVVGEVSTTLHVGVPFNIPLLVKDGYDHLATLPLDLKPVLKCSGLDVSYETVDNHGTTFTINGVKARGRVLNYQQSQTYDLKVTLPGLKIDTQTIKICLLPGNPHSLHVTPDDDLIPVANGNAVTFNVEIHDEAGNITAHPKQIVCCKVEKFPSVATDCSATGARQLVTKQINLKIINGEPQNLKVKFEIPSQKKIPLVEKQLKVLPSTRVSRMELCTNDNLVVTNNEKIDWLAGGSLENLFYKLYDEAGREVPPTAKIASMIKINWSGDVNKEDLVQGKLPALLVPTQVQPALFFQVSYQDQNVSSSFYIVPRPDEPKRLKATLDQNTVKLGQILSGNIKLELVDQYDNVTKTLTSSCERHIAVEAEPGLSKLSFDWQESSCSFLVSGVRFQSGPLGPRELFFNYKSFVERVIVKVTAGVPAKLKLVPEPEKPLQVLNDQGIDTPFVVQLLDEWGNRTTDQRVVVILSSSSPALKLTTSVTSQPVNAEGEASFTVSSVSGPKGSYRLEFKGSLNMKPISGSTVNLTVIPDPNKPVSLSVEYTTSDVFQAGSVFPVFSVTVVSDEGSPMTTFNPAAVSMSLWKGAPSGNAPPPTATELKCSKPRRNEKNDRFHFRDKEIPEQVGKYTIQFFLRIGNGKVLSSKQIPINVEANQPIKLGPDSQPQTPVVSDSKAIANRTLVENMTLSIMDLFGNPAGQDLNGKLVVSMKNSSGDGNKKLPLFEGKTNSVTVRLIKGKAHINRLVMMENSPGENGSTYILLFKPEVGIVPTPLAPFELPFHYSNDAENQRKMSELSVKKNELITTISKSKVIFSTLQEILQLLTNQHLIASQKEQALRNDLISWNVYVYQGTPDVDRLLKEKETEAYRILNTPRRVCSIRDAFKGQQDVLGMVGHLAFVENDDDARVISWHIRGDMDCIITQTVAAATRIYEYTGGRQQVMPLENIFLPPGNRPMPHIRNGRMLFDPPGNPLFAKDLLHFPLNQKSCVTAFKNILGDTILIDDLDSANNYRKAVVQSKQSCPTILTRKGDRVSAKGKFGGAQNKAPPIGALQVFGAPIPQQYYTLKQHIDLLEKHRAALEKRDQAAKDREEHLSKIMSSENRKRQEEMEENMKQLEEIERQLVSTPVRPVKRGLEGAGEPSSFVAKRAK